MLVSTEVNFEDGSISIILRKNNKAIRVKMNLEQLERVFDTLDNPLTRQIMRILGWEIEKIE